MKLRGCGKGRIITEYGAGGELFRRIFILFNDEIFSILSPWQMEVFLMMDCVLRGLLRSFMVSRSTLLCIAHFSRYQTEVKTNTQLGMI
jgi:hypothetical protein